MTIYQFPAERRNEKGAMPGLQTQAADLQARPEEALLSLLFARLTLTGEQIRNNFYQKTAPQMFERNCANEAELLEGAWAPTSCDKGAERSTGKAPNACGLKK
jgi:hypothetical protein